MDDRSQMWSKARRWSLLGLALLLGVAVGTGSVYWALNAVARPGQPTGVAHLVVPAATLPVHTVSTQRALLGRSPASEPTPRRGRRLAKAFLRGRSSVGFERSHYLNNMLVAEPGAVGALQAYLGDWRAMRSPLERVGAIDLLEAVARQEGDAWESVATDAEEALAGLVSEPLPVEALPDARRTLGVEKHRALMALTRVDSLRALRVYGALPRSALAAALQDALIAGLTDNGLPHSLAVARVREASSRAFSP